MVVRSWGVMSGWYHQGLELEMVTLTEPQHEIMVHTLVLPVPRKKIKHLIVIENIIMNS